MNNTPSQEPNRKNTLNESSTPVPKQEKPELKQFNQFINEDFIPGLAKALKIKGIEPVRIELKNGDRPVTGDECWMVVGELSKERCFWVCFNTDKIISPKTIALTENGSNPTVLESFLIDEKKITCALLISRTMQRLNGQKWLGNN